MIDIIFSQPDDAIAALDCNKAVKSAAVMALAARRRAHAKETPRSLVVEALTALATDGINRPTTEQVTATLACLANAADVQGAHAEAAHDAMVAATRRHAAVMAPVRDALEARLKALSLDLEVVGRKITSASFVSSEGSLRQQLLRVPGLDPRALDAAGAVLPPELPEEDRASKIAAFKDEAASLSAAIRRLELVVAQRLLDLDRLQQVAEADGHAALLAAIGKARAALGMVPAEGV